MVQISIVIPAHNEASRLKASVLKLKSFLEHQGYDYEIIIAEDGSRDATPQIAAELASEHPGRIIHLHSARRLGRGRALTKAFNLARGRWLGYMDADLATDLGHIPQALDQLRAGASLVTGSRMAPGARVNRSCWRWVLSIAYNCLVKLLCGSKLSDHQCGFKFMSKPLFLLISSQLGSNHWFWDTELLVRAQRAGFSCIQIPVSWRASGTTKLNLTRDLPEFLIGILRLMAVRAR